MKRALLIFVFQFVSTLSFFTQDSLEYTLSYFLSNEEIISSYVGIELRKENGEVLLMRHSKKLFVPASLQKLFTSSYTLNTLPDDFTFKTYVMVEGEIDSISNTLKGNLIIQTSGDPSLESRFFKTYSFISALNSALKKLNIKFISGKIIISPEINDYQINSQWLWSDLGNYYGAGYSPHTFRDNYVEVFFKSNNKIGDSTSILKIDPFESTFIVDNHVIVGSSNRDLSFAFGAPFQNIRLMKGTIPANKNNYPVKISMHNPKLFLKSAIEKECTQLGIQILNKHSKLFDSSIIDTLITYDSPPLKDLITCVNYHSNNNYAEHLLMKSVSFQNKMVNLDDASGFLELFWKEKLGLTDFTFKDGSGLSRHNLSSPNLFNHFLNFQLNSKPFIKETFLNSLPVAGVSGTLKFLGEGTPIEGNFIGKSGSMSGIRCYSGYFTKNSNYFPFTIMINNFICSDYLIRKHIEKLMIDIYSKL